MVAFGCCGRGCGRSWRWLPAAGRCAARAADSSDCRAARTAARRAADVAAAAAAALRERRLGEGLPIVLAAFVDALHCAARIADRCRHRLRGAAGSSGSAAGTVPARPRSGGNSARRAGSNFPPRSDRPRSARRARAEDISRRHDWPCRGSSRRGRWIHTPVSAGYDCGGCYCCCCCCVVIAPAHALVVIVVLMLTVSHGLLFNNSYWRGSDPLLPQLTGGSPASKIHTLAAALSGIGRTTYAFWRRGRVDLNILLAAALPRHGSPFVTRLADPCPTSAQPVKASRYPFAAKCRFLERKFPVSPCLLCRLTEPRSGPLWQCVTQSGIDSVNGP